MASSLGNVLLDAVIDPDMDPPQHADRGPELAPEQHTKQARAMVWLEHPPKNVCPFLRSELDRLNW